MWRSIRAIAAGLSAASQSRPAVSETPAHENVAARSPGASGTRIPPGGGGGFDKSSRARNLPRTGSRAIVA